MPAGFSISRILFGLTVFALLLGGLIARGPKWLTDFDQSFYVTIAYDLDRHGTFSNGIFTRGEDALAAPQPGMFFAPLYPSMVYAAMQLDPRFDAAVSCAVEAYFKRRDHTTCDVYALPIHILHAVLLTLAALAIGFAAQTILASRRAFSIAAALAAVGFLAETHLFSFVMTESATVAFFSLTTAAWIAGLKTSRWQWLLAAGALFGLLCLTRASYLILTPFLLLPVALAYRADPKSFRWNGAVVFAVAFAVMFVPWIARNAISVGKVAVSEEYGSAAIIERFAFNRMTAGEFALAFPYCVPVIGPPAVKAVAGETAVDRFEWNAPGSFFATGRERRNALTERYKRLDPVFDDILRQEVRETGARHIFTSIPLAWCGLWVSGWWSLFALPLFAWACVVAARERNVAFFLYALPGFVMVGLHAALANHYARYNLGLIGPYSMGAALLIVHALRSRERRRAQAA